MTNNYPIVPSSELVREWLKEYYNELPDWAIKPSESALHIASKAACWGADQELEECINWMLEMDLACSGDIEVLRFTRRPKTTSLAEEALAVVENSAICDHLSSAHETILRHALERLQELEQNN